MDGELISRPVPATKTGQAPNTQHRAAQNTNSSFCVQTLISRSVTATKTGQAPTESYVKRMKLLR